MDNNNGQINNSNNNINSNDKVNNNDQFNKLFYNVFHNKYLLNNIVQQIHKTDWLDRESTLYQNRKYKDMHNLKTMILYNQYSFIKEKLKRNEYLLIKSDAVTELLFKLSLLNQKVIKDFEEYQTILEVFKLLVVRIVEMADGSSEFVSGFGIDSDTIDLIEIVLERCSNKLKVELLDIVLTQSSKIKINKSHLLSAIKLDLVLFEMLIKYCNNNNQNILDDEFKYNSLSYVVNNSINYNKLIKPEIINYILDNFSNSFSSSSSSSSTLSTPSSKQFKLIDFNGLFKIQCLNTVSRLIDQKLVDTNIDCFNMDSKLNDIGIHTPISSLLSILKIFFTFLCSCNKNENCKRYMETSKEFLEQINQSIGMDINGIINGSSGDGICNFENDKDLLQKKLIYLIANYFKLNQLMLQYLVHYKESTLSQDSNFYFIRDEKTIGDTGNKLPINKVYLLKQIETKNLIDKLNNVHKDIELVNNLVRSLSIFDRDYSTIDLNLPLEDLIICGAGTNIYLLNDLLKFIYARDPSFFSDNSSGDFNNSSFGGRINFKLFKDKVGQRGITELLYDSLNTENWGLSNFYAKLSDHPQLLDYHKSLSLFETFNEEFYKNFYRNFNSSIIANKSVQNKIIQLIETLIDKITPSSKESIELILNYIYSNFISLNINKDHHLAVDKIRRLLTQNSIQIQHSLYHLKCYLRIRSPELMDFISSLPGLWNAKFRYTKATSFSTSISNNLSFISGGDSYDISQYLDTDVFTYDYILGIYQVNGSTYYNNSLYGIIDKCIDNLLIPFIKSDNLKSKFKILEIYLSLLLKFKRFNLFFYTLDQLLNTKSQQQQPQQNESSVIALFRNTEISSLIKNYFSLYFYDFISDTMDNEALYKYIQYFKHPSFINFLFINMVTNGNLSLATFLLDNFKNSIYVFPSMLNKCVLFKVNNYKYLESQLLFKYYPNLDQSNLPQYEIKSINELSSINSVLLEQQ